MIEREETLVKLEKKLLPDNSSFSIEQKKVIFSEGDRNIVAGPGSGKTTVLMAKIALLLSEQKEDFKGICIITHTNVAVEEIKSGLIDVGITNIGYPNFIGTIHEFFNYFFAYKAYNEIFPGIKPVFRDEELHKERFIEFFNKYKSSSYDFAPPSTKVEKIHLLFDENKNIHLKEYCHPNYEEALLKTLKEIIKLGEIRHNDSLSLSEWYIKKYNKKIIEGFKKRFSWVFLDEAQDTSIFQYELLKKLFDDYSINFQKFGDPYQALYTLYDNTQDAWLPDKEQNKGIEFDEISQSTRFGESIAKVLRTTCIEEYKTLKGNINKRSFKPHMFLYNTESKVVNEYIKIIEILNYKYEDFKKSNKKVAVVGLTHNDLLRYKIGYKKAKTVKMVSESIIKSYYELILKGLLEIVKDINASLLPNEKSDYNISFLKNNIENNNVKIKSQISTLIIEVLKDRGKIKISSEKLILKVLEEFCNDHFIKNEKALDYSKYIRYIKENMERIYIGYTVTKQSNLIKQEDIEKNIYFGTVHSVKGETHKATLLIESRIPEGDFNNPTIFYDCYSVSNYLMGDFEDYRKIKYSLKRNATRKALKTAYVALSRPTHFAGVAIKKSNIKEHLEDFITKANKAGWEIIDVD